jgi:hypothetical protein
VYVNRGAVESAWLDVLGQSSRNSSTRFMTVNGHRHRVTMATHAAPASAIVQQLMSTALGLAAAGKPAAGDDVRATLLAPKLIEGPDWSAVVALPDVLTLGSGGTATATGRMTLVRSDGPERATTFTIEDLTPASVIDSVKLRRADTDVPGRDATSVVRYPGTRRAFSLLEEGTGTTTNTVAYVGPGLAADHGHYYLRGLRAAGFETTALREQDAGRFFAQLRKESLLVSVYCVVKQGKVVGLIQEMRSQ